MITIGYFSKFPALYKDREKFIKDISFTNIESLITEDGQILIKSSTNKYQQEVLIMDNMIQLNSACKVFCNCESFKYEFANSIFKAGSLLEPLNFIRSIIKRPKEKNQYNTVSGCKHIVALMRQIIKIKIKK